MKNRICFASVDVEHDPGEDPREFKGVENLDKIADIFKKNNISATLFVTGQVLEKYRDLVKEWSRDYEIACHSYTHRFWDGLDLREREKELKNFTNLYREIFEEEAKGFRAPSHLIDQKGMKLLEEKGFLYDSSIIPHYPFFKKYRGYKGKRPLVPYYPKGRRILEIPVAGQLLGIPLVGTWIRKLPFFVYRILFILHKPSFLTFNLHSWDSLNPKLLKKIEETLKILKNKNYQFLNGEQILKNRQ